MAYDTLKAEIRQYIKTNGANEITGQILQNVLLDMVNAYPSLDGYATQQWVQNQLGDMATMTWVGQQGFVTNSALADYLPLTGGVMTGNIIAGELSTGSYSLGHEGLSFSYSYNGSPRYARKINISSVDQTITFYGRDMTAGTVIEKHQITSDKFIVSNGTSAQFLKADGSVDSTSYLPLTGGTITGNLGVNGYLTFGSNLLYSGSSDFYIGRNNSGAVNTGNARLRLGANLAMLYSGLSYNFFGLDSGGNFVCRLYDALIVIDQNQNNKIILLYSYDEYNGALRTDCDFISDGSVTGSSFIKTGGTSSQFLKADGSVDSNTYLTTAILNGYATETWVGNNYLPLTGGTLTGGLTMNGSLTMGTNKSIRFTTDDYVYLKRESSRLLIVNESGDDIIIGDWDDRNYITCFSDLQGGEGTSSYTSVLAQKWHILRDGSAMFSSVSQGSDIRYKTKTGDVDLSIEDIANAPLFKFTWKDGKNGNVHIGTSAQYWQGLMPELVSENKNGVLGMQYDVAVMAGVITVAKRVVDHEQRIAELEKENALLKAKLNIN